MDFALADQVFLGQGNASFKEGLSYAVAPSPRTTATADFNGDGRPDLAVASQTGNFVSVYLNGGCQ